MENELAKSMHKVDEIPDEAAVYVTDNVFNTIIGLAISEVDGVHSLADYATEEALTKQSQRTFNRCSKLDFGENEVDVSLWLNIAYGSNVPEVANNVQNKVISVISDMIGYTVGQINITVADVVMP
ncbi:MAG: Asp23/Gls24 family envelope stress response protein [Lachnospiraceae bacterium]|nr:Asp23/Gls24 family envelope stress response protein [Lachnospiraceae bacterium]MBQ6195810.1 Asp23/Gls24 family envelope stress response protein [Lachnospiraceae bacterium]